MVHSIATQRQLVRHQPWLDAAGNTPAARFTLNEHVAPRRAHPSQGSASTSGLSLKSSDIDGPSSARRFIRDHAWRPSPNLAGLQLLMQEMIEPYAQRLNVLASQGRLKVPETFQAPAADDPQAAYADHLIGGLRRVADQRARLLDEKQLDRATVIRTVDAASNKDRYTRTLLALAEHLPLITVGAALNVFQPFQPSADRAAGSNPTLADGLKHGMNYAVTTTAQRLLGPRIAAHVGGDDPYYLKPAANQLPTEITEVLRQLDSRTFVQRVLHDQNAQTGFYAAAATGFAAHQGLTWWGLPIYQADLVAGGAKLASQMALGPTRMQTVHGDFERKSLQSNPALMLFRKDADSHLNTASKPVVSAENLRRVAAGAAKSLASPFGAALPASNPRPV